MAEGPIDDKPSICVQLINYNGSQDTLACIDGILKGEYRNLRIVVVDNGSTESENTILKKGIPPEVHLIESKENLGFGRANNLAWKYVKTNIDPEYLLLLNNDTQVTANFLLPLVEVLNNNQEVGAVSPKIMLMGGNHIDSAGSVFTSIGSAYSRGHGEEDEGQYGEEQKVPMVTACCMLIRAKALENTYLFDSNFFMYLEELDLILRLYNRGHQFMFTPHSVIHHEFSHSVKGNIDDKVLFKQCCEEGNRVRILMKHFPFLIIAKNLVPISISFGYWQYRFLTIGGISWWGRLNRNILEGLRDGLESRRCEGEHRNVRWNSYIENWSFINLIRRGQRMEGRYGWK